jgi:hypothetical protein
MKTIISKIRLFILYLGVALTGISCVDALLNQEPTTQLPQASFWTSPDDALTALYGAYSNVRGVFDYDFHYDAFTETVYIRGFMNRVTQNDLHLGGAYIGPNYTDPSGFGTAYDNMFRYLYNGVHLCNSIIDNIDRMLPNVRPDQVTALEAIRGEACLLRGMCYFRLISLWGDVPLIDHIVSGNAEVANIARTPIAQIKDFILDDFTYAGEKLPDKGAAVGRAGKPAAFAFRGKMQLFWASWNQYGWSELEGFTPSQSEANAAYAAAAADFRKVIDDFGLTLYKNGEPGPCDPLGQASNLPYYYELFTPEANGAEECLMVFTHGGPGTNQGEQYLRMTGGTRHGPSQQWMSPRLDLVNRYQSTITGDFCDPLIPCDPGQSTGGVPNRELLNSAVNPQSYANRDYRLKASVLWDYEISQGMIGQQPIGWVPFVYRSWGVPTEIFDGSAVISWGIDDNSLCYAFRKFLRRTQPEAARDQGSYNWPAMRLADVYLMYAEADNAINGPQPKAIELVNKIRHRGKLPALAASKTANKTAFFAAIEQERIIELVAEGHRFFDMRRWRKLEEIWGGVGGPGRWRTDTWGIRHNISFQNATELMFQRCYILRIPPSERDKNPNLTQNKPFL